MHALINNNIVSQLCRVDPSTIYAPQHAALFVPCGDEVREGWLWDGEAFSEPPAPAAGVTVPQSVTMRQARLALLGAGLLASVDAAIASLPSPTKEEVSIEWEYSQTVERDRPFVAMLGAALGLDSAELDALFIAAAAL